MHPSVKTVVPRDNCLLYVTFSNGENGSLDMKPYLDFGVFKRIKDYNTFARVRAAFYTIKLESGVDLDPEFVYQKCKIDSD